MGAELIPLIIVPIIVALIPVLGTLVPFLVRHFSRAVATTTPHSAESHLSDEAIRSEFTAQRELIQVLQSEREEDRQEKWELEATLNAERRLYRPLMRYLKELLEWVSRHNDKPLEDPPPQPDPDLAELWER